MNTVMEEKIKQYGADVVLAAYIRQQFAANANEEV
jgi:hypothetical protein